MIDIFKAMSYRMIKSRVTYYCLFLSVLFPFLLALSATSESIEEITIQGIIDNVTLIGFVVIFVFISLFICGDYRSKTLYYEVMNGHSRFEVYTGRTLAMLLFGFVMYNIQLSITLFMSKFLVGYQLASEGVEIAILKIIVVELCALGFLMFFVFSALALKNIIVSLSISWFGLMGSSVIALLSNSEITSNGDTLSSVFGSGAIKYTLSLEFSSSGFIISVIIALMLSAFFYFLGLHIFKKSELH